MRASQRIVLCTAALLLIPAQAQQLSPVGDWKTVDDKTGKPKAIVRVYENNGELFGKIEKILDPARVIESVTSIPTIARTSRSPA